DLRPDGDRDRDRPGRRFRVADVEDLHLMSSFTTPDGPADDQAESAISDGESDVSENFPTNSEPQGEESPESLPVEGAEESAEPVAYEAREEQDFEVDLGQDNFASGQDDSDDVGINLDFGSDTATEAE